MTRKDHLFWFPTKVTLCRENETDAVSPSETKAKPETPDLWRPPLVKVKGESGPQMARPGRTSGEKVSICHTLTIGADLIWWETRMKHLFAHMHDWLSARVAASTPASVVWEGKKIRLNLHDHRKWNPVWRLKRPLFRSWWSMIWINSLVLN